MPRIFGRDALPNHPLDAKLAPLDDSQSWARFVAENWRYDWRVSAEREEVVLKRTSTTSSQEYALQALRERHYQTMNSWFPHGGAPWSP